MVIKSQRKTNENLKFMCYTKNTCAKQYIQYKMSRSRKRKGNKIFTVVEIHTKTKKKTNPDRWCYYWLTK